MIKVTYVVNSGAYAGNEIVEEYSDAPHANGFVPDYNLRASAMGWSVVKVEKDVDMPTVEEVIRTHRFLNSQQAYKQDRAAYNYIRQLASEMRAKQEQ